jgi:hypothetical protein
VTETQRAYIAGVVDGEGCISLSKTRVKRKTFPFYTYTYHLSLSIGNTNKEIIEYINNVYPSNIYLQAQCGWKKRAYIWKISDTKLVPFLKKIERYLIIKKKQCVLAKQYFNSITKNKIKGFHQMLDEGEVSKREKFYQKFKLLNKKGTKI